MDVKRAVVSQFEILRRNTNQKVAGAKKMSPKTINRISLGITQAGMVPDATPAAIAALPTSTCNAPMKAMRANAILSEAVRIPHFPILFQSGSDITSSPVFCTGRAS